MRINQLNSILIEGTVTGEPEITTDDEGHAMAVFHIINHMIDGDTLVTITTEGALARKVFANLAPGLSVRAVGSVKLAIDTYYIKAKHIEYREGKSDRGEVLEQEE